MRIIQLVPQDKGDDETEGVTGTPAATHTAGGFKRYSHTQNALRGTVAADTRVFPDEQDLLAKIMDGRCPETTLCENCEGSAQFMPREHFGVHHHSE